MTEPLIPAHGGYRNLLTCRLGNLIYDATAAFCARWISRRDRTFDQMVQAARPANLTQLRQVMAGIVSDLSDRSDKTDKSDLLLEVGCNTMITLINQETYLLARQIARLAEDFTQNGGFTERLYRVRSEKRLEK